MFYKCKLSTPFELDKALSIIVFYISPMHFDSLKHAVCIVLVNHAILTNISFCIFIIFSFVAALVARSTDLLTHFGGTANNSLTNIIKNNKKNDNINIGDSELDSFNTIGLC